MAVNHKRVLRLMGEDNRLGIEPKAFVVTTQSNYESEVCLNLARRMKLTAINQLLVADITYIRPGDGSPGSSRSNRAHLPCAGRPKIAQHDVL